MNQVTRSFFRHFKSRPVRQARYCLLAVFLLLSGGGIRAQDLAAGTQAEQGAELAVEAIELLAIEALPEPVNLAAALSDRESRIDTLFTLIAVERLLTHAKRAVAVSPEILEARFLDERDWLDRLALRYARLPFRGSELDPAAWAVLNELADYQMRPGIAVSPAGPDDASLARQLFDRSNERLSAAVLPEVLRRTEIKSTVLWVNLLETAAANQALHATLSSIYTDWLHRWVTADQPETDSEASLGEVIGEALVQLNTLAASVMMQGPVEDQALKRLRFDLLTALPRMGESQSRDAGYILVLASAIDGLQDSRYLEFAEALLNVVSDLLLNEKVRPEPVIPAEQVAAATRGGEPVLDPVETVEVAKEDEAAAGEDIPPPSVIPGLLSDLLPGFSNAFAGSFSDVDPRINASLAAVFDVVQYLKNNPGPHERTQLSAMQRNIGNAVAQLVLQIPDLDYYFEQPVRRRIATEIDECTNIAAETIKSGTAGFSREQFDGCIKSLVDMSRNLVSREELSGDSYGPFGSEQLQRELVMPPWQRINFNLGYLHDRFPTGCELPDQPLPNPLEWSTLATVITWFARQAPVYFQTPENEELLLAMRQQGLDMLKNLFQQVDCFSGQGVGINDPVRRSLSNYRLALNELVAGIRQAELDFRASRLRPGADVALHSDASQRTAYRTDGLMIGPCDPQAVCEMSGQLEATRALIGLFPDTYLIADQTGLGSVEICYKNMEWVDRRAVPVRPEDNSVANYFGRLSFELVGRYQENGVVSEVFGSTLVSPDEYHYLFAAATDEVLDDNCPVEWVGSRVVTTLKSNAAFRVVPDRLTYLASAREKPSEVIEANWSRGAEWRDWFVTGLGVTPHDYPADETISGRVNQHLRRLYQAEQSMIYNALLRSQSRGTGGEAMESLLNLQEELTARKALVRAYLNLFYPDAVMDSDAIRGALEGYGSLLDTDTLMRFRESNVAVSSINEAGISRIERFQADWNRQPETVRRSGSIAVGVAHAIIRLNAVYYQFFVLPAEKNEAREAATDPFG